MLPLEKKSSHLVYKFRLWPMNVPMLASMCYDALT